MADRKIKDDRARRAAILKSIVGDNVDARTRAALEASEGAEEAARFIREMRQAAKLTQSALADRLGVKQARISEIERGGTPEGVSYALLRRVAIACGFPDWPASPLPGRTAAAKHVPVLDPVRVTVVAVDMAKMSARDPQWYKAMMKTKGSAAVLTGPQSGSPQQHVVLVGTSRKSRAATGATAAQGQQDQWHLIRNALVSSPDIKILDEK